MKGAEERCFEGSRGGERERDVLKMNFSVGVSMYRLNVTSYWYLLRCNQRNVDANMDIVTVVHILVTTLLFWVSMGLARR
jgi:hypothetical protein